MASTRPSRCCAPRLSATFSMPLATPSPSGAAVAEATLRVAALRAEESSLAARRDEVRRRADYLRHVVDEIDGAKVKPGEDEALQLEARRLSRRCAGGAGSAHR